MNKYKKELLDRLARANKILKEADLFLDLVVVGGSAFVLKGLIPRATYDIDSLAFVEEEIQMLIMDEADINSRVLTFEATFGEWKEDIEFIEESNLSNISLKTISTERLIASRCFSLRRQDDAIETAKNYKLNKEKFENVVEEIKSYTDPIYSKEFSENEELIKNIYKLQGWDYENSNTKNLYKK